MALSIEQLKYDRRQVASRAPRRCARPATLIASCALGVVGLASSALGQAALPATAAAMPEPIYWKQDLFLVPYQWGSAAEAGAAQAVWLFVSKDRGTTWQKISEAKPQVTAFNYRAEGDGEYWFAVRTLDKYGRAWPAGPYQPELRVIVDTMMPQIIELVGKQFGDGNVEITWRGADQNLDPSTLKVEAQIDAAGTWQTVEGAGSREPGAGSGNPGIHAGQVLWQPPAGSRPVAIRATVLDRAGNPATYQTQITSAPGVSAAALVPTLMNASSGLPISQSPPMGWISSSAAVAQPTSQPVSQPWPAVATNRAPFRLSSSAASLPDDGVTAYGNPPSIVAPEASGGANSDRVDHGVEARYAGPVPVVRGSPDAALSESLGRQLGEVGRPAPNGAEPRFSPLEPFRQASVTRLPTPGAGEVPIVDTPPTESYTPPHNPPVQPKLVGSRTFSLEYDLDEMGRWGVTKVELWGTRDGGRTWRSYARDDDQRSPLVVTVDEEGLYGFRIIVESAGSTSSSPKSGDEPELWVAVDMHRPVIELTAIERGHGNLADHLVLRWQAADDNLEPHPIGLFYSSRSAGPWSAIATSLQDTGEYAWRVERHVPSRFYLRVEARDTAGNLAAFQTREPVEFSSLEPSGRLRGAEPVGPTATGGSDSYR